MTSESQRTLLSLRPTPSFAAGLSLVELLIAIGIMGTTMVLIGAAFPAGMAMSIAVSDETTSQAVFQKALAVIRDNYSVAKITDDFNVGELAPDDEYDVVQDVYLGVDSGTYNAGVGRDNRIYEFISGQESNFSWSVLMRRMGTTGPMGNLFQVVVVVSRQKLRYDSNGNPVLPDLQSVNCTSVDTSARTMTMGGSVPNGGYMIDETTGTAYIIVSLDNNTVTTLSTPPSDAASKSFWVVPGPGSSLRPPSIRVFQAMLYLP